MSNFKTPFSYIIAIYGVIFISFVNYIVLKYSVMANKIQLGITILYFNYFLIIAWLVVNTYMIFYLKKNKANNIDFILPIYFVIMHLFYTGTVVIAYLKQLFIPEFIALIISITTTVFEFTFASYLLNKIFFQSKQFKNNKSKQKRALPKKKNKKIKQSVTTRITVKK